MVNLADTVRQFDAELRDCSNVSLKYSGIPSPTQRHYWASVIFTALCTRSASLLTLVPHSTLAKKELEVWDYAAVGALVRSVFELRLTLFHLCIEVTSDDEWYCRLQLIHLHDCVSRQLLFEDMDDAEGAAAFVAQAKTLRSRLETNAYFMQLPERRRSHLLRGKQAFLSALEDIAVSSGTDLRTFRVLYRFLSTNAHGLPMAFHRVGETRGRGIRTDTEESYIQLWLHFAADVIAEARSEYEHLWKKSDA